MNLGSKSVLLSREPPSGLRSNLEVDCLERLLRLHSAPSRSSCRSGDKGKKDKRPPKREPLPPHLPRRDVLHEPESTACGCGCPMKRIGQDVSEKLDYEPGVFTVERHVRGKWACARCQKLVQAPVPPHIIHMSIPTASLLAQVLVAKFLDHLPLYRQEFIFKRVGMAIARSTLAQWVGECGAQLQPLVDALSAELRRHGVLHADETPVAMLKPGNKKTHTAYIWTYCTTSFNPTKAVGKACGKHGHDARCAVDRLRALLVEKDVAHLVLADVRPFFLGELDPSFESELHTAHEAALL